MNILIKEFAEQATVDKQVPCKQLDGWTSLETVRMIDPEKFAELIVKECNRYACSAWEHGPLLGRDLLIHFGVEEMTDD